MIVSQAREHSAVATDQYNAFIIYKDTKSRGRSIHSKEWIRVTHRTRAAYYSFHLELIYG